MNALTSASIRNILEQMGEKYNADNDCSPVYPTVNWTDRQLADCIYSLLDIIEALQDRIEDLEADHRDRENIALYSPTKVTS